MGRAFGAAAAMWSVAGAALAQVPSGPGGKLGRVFGDAGPEVKLLVAGLLLAAIAGLALWALGAAQRRARGLGFLRGLRVVGPLLGGIGAAYVLTNGFLVLGILAPEAPLVAFAPGIAEAMLSILVGLFAGLAGVLGYEQLRGRARAAA